MSIYKWSGRRDISRGTPTGCLRCYGRVRFSLNGTKDERMNEKGVLKRRINHCSSSRTDGWDLGPPVTLRKAVRGPPISITTVKMEDSLKVRVRGPVSNEIEG